MLSNTLTIIGLIKVSLIIYMIIVILILIILWLVLKPSYDESESVVVSNVDGLPYNIKNKYDDDQTAADILATLNKINYDVIEHLKNKHADTHMANDIKFLEKNYRSGGSLSENMPKSTVNTSFVVNKGDVIKICLRSPKTGEFQDFQTILFVNLHELSHLLDRDYGHESGFWDGFRTVLVAATEIGAYKPVDYSQYPVSYCGITITNNPMYN